MDKLVLASGSTWRLAMLRAVGLAPIAHPADLDERALQAEMGDAGPGEVALQLAIAKAEAVASHHPEAVVIGADQVLELDGEVIGKPVDPEDHLQRLMGMRGRTHALMTGWCVRDSSGAMQMGIARSQLTMRADLSDEELHAYVLTGEGSGCAGGYAVEGHGGWLFERVDGDWNNIIGLPLFDLLTALRELGFRYGGGDESGA